MTKNNAHRRTARAHQKATGDAYMRSLREVDSGSGDNEGGAGGDAATQYRWWVRVEFHAPPTTDEQVEKWESKLPGATVCYDEIWWEVQVHETCDSYQAALGLLRRAPTVIGGEPTDISIFRKVWPERNALLRAVMARRMADADEAQREAYCDDLMTLSPTEWAEDKALVLDFLRILRNCGLAEDEWDDYIDKPWKWSFERELWEAAGSPEPPVHEWPTPEPDPSAWNGFEELVNYYWDDSSGPAEIASALESLYDAQQ